MEQCDKNSVILERFQKLISDSGNTRQTIAQAIGCDTSTVTKQYNGDMKISVDYLVKYARYFGVSTDYLLGLTDSPTTDIDLRSVCEYTGLSDEAVKALQLDTSKDIKEITNFFLSKKGYADYYELCTSMSSLPYYYEFLIGLGEFIKERYYEGTISKDLQDEYSEDMDMYLANKEYADLHNFHLTESLNQLKAIFCGKSLERYRRKGLQIELSRYKMERDKEYKDWIKELKKRQGGNNGNDRKA